MRALAVSETKMTAKLQGLPRVVKVVKQPLIRQEKVVTFME